MAMQTIREVLKRIPAILVGAYESPAEECLGERLRSAIHPMANYQTQVWVETSVSRFRLDILLIEKTGRRIVVEVDGKEFHEPVRDHWRTVFIMAEGLADVVYRVPASDLKINLVGVLAGLAALEPLCFSEEDVDVPPVLSSTVVWSPIPHLKEIGREEAVYRRTDHRLPA